MIIVPLRVYLLGLGLALRIQASERPEVGPWDRYRVEVPDYPGAEATSEGASVLLAPPEGLPWTIEEAPSLDEGQALPGDDVGLYDALEGIDALAARPWREAGFDGTGIKVAVFDSQYYNAELWANELGDYYTNDCQAARSCDLPIDTLRPTYSFEEGSHGVACAQVIHDIAPGVELHLVRVNGSATLENAAAWAVRNDIDIVSMSMSFFSNSFYDGSGYVSTVAAQMAAQDTLLVNSAGNYATEHWDGAFTDPDGDGDMDFPWGLDCLPMYFAEGDASAIVSWDQFSSCGDTDLDVYAYDGEGNVIGRAEANQPNGESCSPVERLTVHAPATDWYCVQIVRRAGDSNTHVAAFARDGYVYLPTPGSIADPGSSPSSFTVGAVRAVGYLQNNVEGFSSIGPTQSGLAKPDIAGPDGLTTAVFGSQGFYGTSAATPAVAATLALIMQAEGTSPREAANQLASNAISDHRTWTEWDGELGAGKARLWSRDGAQTGCSSTRNETNPWVILPTLLWCSAVRSDRKKR